MLVLTIKKSIAITLLATAFIATITPYTARATELPTVAISPQKVKAEPNVPFSINITITNVEDLYACELKLRFDIDILVPQFPPSEGSFLKSSGHNTYYAWTYDPISGSFMIGTTLLGVVPGASGNGTLVTIEFFAFQEGDCILDLYDTRLWDCHLSLIDHKLHDGVYGAPVFADVTQRKAWPGRHHFSITRDKSGVQSLYGKVRNLGDRDCYIRMTFEITDESVQSLGVFQAIYVIDDEETKISPGESATLSVDLWESRESSWSPGKYYVEATCVCSAGSLLWESSVLRKNFAFTIVP